MQQLRESGQLLLQGGDLGRQLRECPQQVEELWWQRRLLCWPCGSRRRPLLWQSRKAAMRGAGQEEQVVAGQPFEARIGGMRVRGELSLGQPAAQGFGINGQQTATVGQRQDGHGATPFVLQVTKTTTGPGTSWEFSAERSWEFSPVLSREGSVERSWEFSPEMSRETRSAVSWNARPRDTQQTTKA